MTKLLPGSSEPNQSEIESLQQWCDRAPLGTPVPSGDLHDFDVCIELISKITGSPPNDSARSSESNPSTTTPQSDTPSEPRFRDPTWIGSGAHGIIFSATDTQRKHTQVAIKILRPSRQRNRIARERFIEEAKLMQGLNHPNIAVVVDTGAIEDLPYIVTELASSGSLASYLLKEPHAFSARQAAWLVKSVAEAVHYAHSIPILHRDLKPGNILLKPISPEISEGTGVWPLLTDFGLSKNLGPEPTGPRTRFGEVLGTLAYMSPEQVRGEALKTQSDIFPLGVILYELAHGSHPFLARNNFDTQQNIVQGSLPKSSGSTRHVPKALDAIISKCLQKKVEDRYQSAIDLATDLDHFLQGKPISVTPPTPLELLSQLVRSNPIATTFVATVFCALILTILLLQREWQIQREMTQTQREMTQTQRELTEAQRELTLQAKSLADDRAAIGDLFLESLLVSNDGIYDTILSGQRVSVESLQAILEQQFPLLESALRLDPNDADLIRQLQVNYHYVSLCYKCKIDERVPTNDRALLLEQAIEARKKSLEYLELLLDREPGLAKLIVAKANGLHWLSLLYSDAGESELCLETVQQLLVLGREFLQKHPDDKDMPEILNTSLLLYAELLQKSAPEESLSLYSSITDSSLKLFAQDQSRLSNLVYVIQAQSRHGSLLMQLGDTEEAMQDFARVRETYRSYRDEPIDQWKLAETMFIHYLESCAACLQSQQYESQLVLANEWCELVNTANAKNYALSLYYSNLSNPDTRLLVPLYFRLLALNQVHGPDSELTINADEDLQACIDRCVAYEDLAFSPPAKPYSYSKMTLECLDGLRARIAETQNNK